MNKFYKELLEWLKLILIAFILALFVKSFIIETVKVNGASMEPTLHHNDKLIVSRLAYKFYSPTRGDIIILKHSDKDNYVKRIIGIAGDKIEVINEKVYLNDIPQNETYIKDFTGGFYGPHIVPAGKVFVLGDNRNNSQDSRSKEVSDVDTGKVIGKVVYRFWPLSSFNTFNE